MNIAVVGTGYVGLVTGTCLAETGNKVICVDIDEEKVKSLQNGIITIYEPGLEPLFKRNIQQGRLSFTTDLEHGVVNSDIIFLALPTPPGEDGSADLSHILEVAKQIGPMITEYKVIIDKSTVPVGTADKVRALVETEAKADFDVVSNPEFLREGVAVDDFMKPDRVVVGTTSQKARDLMDKLFEPMVRQGNPIIFMDERSAELTKYAANSFLATKITFMNEVANLCERMGADVDMVRKGIGTDTRIGNRFLFAGIGYGGSCFPKDVKALGKSSKEFSYDFKLLNSVMEVNMTQKTRLIEKAKKHFDGSLSGKSIAAWGLSFKPYTDDIREAPSLENIDALLREGAKVTAFDPEGMENAKRVLGDSVQYASNEYDCLDDVDALFIFTEWPVFRNPDFEIIKSRIKNPTIFDGRNLYSLDHMRNTGFNYFSIGRKDIVQ